MTMLPLSEEDRRKLEDQYKQKYQSLPEILTSLADPRAAFLNALSGSVGNNMDNNDEDVRAVRRGFDEIWERPITDRETDHLGRPLGIITQQMDDDIHRFQKENDLKVDGYMHPRGETVNALVQKVAAKQVSQQEPTKKEISQKTRLPEKAQQKESIPAPPAYKKEWFKGNRASQWEAGYRAIEKRTDLTPEVKQQFKEIFAAEGGLEIDKASQAYGGVTPKTLERHLKAGNLPKIKANYPQNVEPKDLDPDDLIDVYKAHMDDITAAARIGYQKNHSQNLSGPELLSKLGPKLGGAIADTLFVNDQGVTVIQKAINRNVPDSEKVRVEDKNAVFGSQTFQALEKISKDEKKVDVFLDSLGPLRVEREGQAAMGRVYYHRYNY